MPRQEVSLVRFRPPAAPEILLARNETGIRILQDKLQINPSPEAVRERCQRRVELCELMMEADPRNATWKYGMEFFEAFPEGPQAVWTLFGKWGVFAVPGRLTPPFDLADAQPRELMDPLGPIIERSSLDPEKKVRAKALAIEGETASWLQYQVTKDEILRADLTDMIEIALGVRITNSALLALVERISRHDGEKGRLLAQGFVADSLRMARELESPLVPLALSSDEINAFMEGGSEGLIIAGVAKGYSPAMKEMMDLEQVKPLSSQQTDPRDLSLGNYLATADANKGLPFVSDSGVVVEMNGLHHNTRKQQIALLQEMVRVAVKPKKGKAAVLVVEPYSHPNLLAMVLAVNGAHESAAFDALVGTTIGGGQTVEGILNLAREACPDIEWEAGLWPNLPPIKSFQSSRLCYQQVWLKAA